MSDIPLTLSRELYDYLLKNSVQEPEILSKLRIQTHKMSMGHMQVSPEQGQFMGLLVKLLNAKKTLEIGVFTGYSTLAVALALPPNGKIVACDINVEWTRIAKDFWEKAGVSEKVDLRLAPALDTLNELIDQGGVGTFDFVFIDADKKNYWNYYELSLSLLRPGGLILIDNVLWYGDVADESVQDQNTLAIREFNQKIFQDQRVFITMLPIRDGVTLALKK